jgi:hypothetical protein
LRCPAASELDKTIRGENLASVGLVVAIQIAKQNTLRNVSLPNPRSVFSGSVILGETTGLHVKL